MEGLNVEQRHTGSSSSEISLNTNDLLKDLALEFGENSDDIDSSSSVISLLGESLLVQRDVYKNNSSIIKSDQQMVMPAAPTYYKFGLAGVSDFDNEGTDSEICEINSKGKYSTIKDAVYVPPKYLIPEGIQNPTQNSETLKQDSSTIVQTHGKMSFNNISKIRTDPNADSGKTSCSSFSSDEACGISLPAFPNRIHIRPSSNKSWTTSSSSLEGDIESFVDEELGEESDSDIDTNRTITRVAYNTFNTNCSISHHGTIQSSTSNLHSQDDTRRNVNVITPTKLEKSEYYSPTSSSSEASLVDVKSKMIQHLTKKLTYGRESPPDSANAQKSDENEIGLSFLTRKLHLLKIQPVSEIKNAEASYASEAKEFATEREEVVPTTWINLLQLKTFQNRLETLATDPMHNPNNCTSCREAADVIEQKTVLRSLLVRAQRPIMQEKIDNHFVNNNSISLIGELARSLPKPSTEVISKLK